MIDLFGRGFNLFTVQWNLVRFYPFNIQRTFLFPFIWFVRFKLCIFFFFFLNLLRFFSFGQNYWFWWIFWFTIIFRGNLKGFLMFLDLINNFVWILVVNLLSIYFFFRLLNLLNSFRNLNRGKICLQINFRSIIDFKIR